MAHDHHGVGELLDQGQIMGDEEDRHAAFAPQAADARLAEDHLVSAKKIWAGQYSDNILEVIDWCLRLDPLERPQSVFALQKAIREIPQTKRKVSFFGSLKKMLFSEISA